MRGSLPFLCGAAALSLSMLLGGGTRGGFLSDAILELAALPVFLLVCWKLLDAKVAGPMRGALFFCSALVLVPVLQLVPLPPFLWTVLPGRAAVEEAARLATGAPGWKPLTLSPARTMQAMLSLIPAFAVFGATLLLAHRERRRLSLLVVALCLTETLVGLAQIAGGPGSPLRPYAITSVDAAVGLFANPNHLALAFGLAIAFTAAWGVSAAQATKSPSRRRSDTSPIATVLMAATAIFVLLIGVVATRSRAGIGLSLLALIGGLAFAPWRPAGWSACRTLLIGAACVLTAGIALVVIADAPLAALLARLTDGGGFADRLAFASKTATIAWGVFPVGTGVGSFVPVYALHENAADLPAGVFVNRAHCDWIEAVMESGVFAIVMIAAFCLWFVRSASRVWLTPSTNAAVVDVALQRAATIVIALIGLHSLIEYPLRTSGIAVLFAFACGCLFTPTAETTRGRARGMSWQRDRQIANDGNPG